VIICRNGDLIALAVARWKPIRRGRLGLAQLLLFDETMSPSRPYRVLRSIGYLFLIAGYAHLLLPTIGGLIGGHLLVGFRVSSMTLLLWLVAFAAFVLAPVSGQTPGNAPPARVPSNP
jgi:hypothetical protein